MEESLKMLHRRNKPNWRDVVWVGAGLLCMWGGWWYEHSLPNRRVHVRVRLGTKVLADYYTTNRFYVRCWASNGWPVYSSEYGVWSSAPFTNCAVCRTQKYW